MLTEFKEYRVHGSRCWVSGIYKITEYVNDRDPVHYQVYMLMSYATNWGNYVDRKQQHQQYLTFDQCVNIAMLHSVTYEPEQKQIDRAAVVEQRMAENDWRKTIGGGCRYE